MEKTGAHHLPLVVPVIVLTIGEHWRCQWHSGFKTRFQHGVNSKWQRLVTARSTDHQAIWNEPQENARLFQVVSRLNLPLDRGGRGWQAIPAMRDDSFGKSPTWETKPVDRFVSHGQMPTGCVALAPVVEQNTGTIHRSQARTRQPSLVSAAVSRPGDSREFVGVPGTPAWLGYREGESWTSVRDR